MDGLPPKPVHVADWSAIKKDNGQPGWLLDNIPFFGGVARAASHYGLYGEEEQMWGGIASAVVDAFTLGYAGGAGGFIEGGLASASEEGITIASGGFNSWAGNAPLSDTIAEFQQALINQGKVSFTRGQFSLGDIGNIASGLESEIAITRLGQTRYMTLSGTYGGFVPLSEGEVFIGHVHPGVGFWGIGSTTFGTDMESMSAAGIRRQAVLNESGAFRIIRSNGTMSTIFNIPSN